MAENGWQGNLGNVDEVRELLERGVDPNRGGGVKRAVLVAFAIALGACSTVDLDAQLERERSIMTEYIATVTPNLTLTTTERLTMQSCPPDGSESHTIEASGAIDVEDVAKVLQRSAEYFDAQGWTPSSFTNPPSVSGRTDDNEIIIDVRAFEGRIRISVYGVDCGFPDDP